ncbi:MAG TPA: DUF4389 domain-containing protein [Solirubrobacterales bacterium]|nr:DUF4389 domain-containing protein [Solirubrobacterales bacterium]
MEASTPTPPPPEQPPPEPPPAPGGPAPGAYPVRLEAQRQDEYHRFLPLVKWLLAFPHYIVLIFLAIGLVFVKIVAFFAVLFTGRYPRGMYDFVAGVIRWSWRVTAYVYLLRDEYPPFTLDEDPSYPATFEIDYPEHIDNWRPLVQWLLAIPYLIVAGVLVAVAGIVAFIGIFVILFTKELPKGMFDLILIPYRWQVRGSAYAYFMVDRYPPFVWEE